MNSQRFRLRINGEYLVHWKRWTTKCSSESERKGKNVAARSDNDLNLVNAISYLFEEMKIGSSMVTHDPTVQVTLADDSADKSTGLEVCINVAA